VVFEPETMRRKVMTVVVDADGVSDKHCAGVLRVESCDHLLLARRESEHRHTAEVFAVGLFAIFLLLLAVRP
jgi:hypothetical protein